MGMVQIEMESPKNCYECPFNKGEYSPDCIEKRYCCLTGRLFSENDYIKRSDECPIVDVTEGK